MNYHSNDAERLEQRTGRSYGVVYIAVAIVLFIAMLVWVVQLTGRSVQLPGHRMHRPQDNVVAPPPAAVIISEPKVDKIQDKLETPAPAPELKPAVDMPPEVAADPVPAKDVEPAPVEAPAVEAATPESQNEGYANTNRHSAGKVFAPPEHGGTIPAPRFGEEINRKPLRHRHFRHDSAVKEITHRNTVKPMRAGLRRVLADGAGRAVRCQGDCSLAAMFCKASARGAGLIR